MTLRGGVSRGHCSDSREEKAETLSQRAGQGEDQASSSIPGAPATSASRQCPERQTLPAPRGPSKDPGLPCTVRPREKELSRDPLMHAAHLLDRCEQADFCTGIRGETS